MLKTCKKCETELPLSSFHKNKNCSFGVLNTCKKCRVSTCRDEQLRYKYGISNAQYESKYKEQKGACKICRKNFDQLVVDHDHNTGDVRGLLCHSCNKGLGLFFDNVSALENAIIYLAEHSGSIRNGSQSSYE